MSVLTSSFYSLQGVELVFNGNSLYLPTSLPLAAGGAREDDAEDSLARLCKREKWRDSSETSPRIHSSFLPTLACGYAPLLARYCGKPMRSLTNRHLLCALIAILLLPLIYIPLLVFRIRQR